MKLHQFILPALAVASPACVPPQSGANSTNVYDYIVIGSGPGGGTISVNLAKAGYSVLLLEAGEDRSEDIRTQVLSLGSFSNTEATWHFFVRHSDDEARNARYNLLVWRLANGEYWIGKDPSVEGHVGATRLGVFYPRGATLGGSAVVNAAATFLPMDSDWDYFDKGVGDGVWSGKDMRRIFEKIEHNNYLPKGTPGHGFTGWLQTNIASSAVYAGTLRMKIFEAALKLIGKDPSKAVEYSTTDGNFLSPTRDQQQGLWALPFHVEPNWRRWSPRDRILQTLAEKKAPLKVSLNSLASKVLFDECGYGKPKAVGVEYLQGKNIFRADPHYKNSNAGTKKQVFARKEVIVSGGAFSSPQILQLSGIGDKKLLKSLNIKVISDLPGVGRNLQDNYELPIIGEAKISLTDPVDPNAPKCTNGAPGDPCLDLWRQGKGPYAQGGSNANSFMLKTKYAVENERDMLLFSTGDFPLRGFVPDTNQNMTRDPPTTFSWSTVKMHPQNGAGYIKIKSNNPQDTPDINLNYFAEGGETDLNAILETIAFGRKTYASTEGPVGPVKPFSPPCPNVLADGSCSDVNIDKEWIKDQAFGHHPTSSNSVGPDSNPLAVLDTRLRVKGVRNLRVVDASAFPRCPGAFPAVASYMLGEKASELVLEDAKKNN